MKTAVALATLALLGVSLLAFAAPADARVLVCADVGEPTDCGGYWICYPDLKGGTACWRCPFANTAGCDWVPPPGIEPLP